MFYFVMVSFTYLDTLFLWASNIYLRDNLLRVGFSLFSIWFWIKARTG